MVYQTWGTGECVVRRDLGRVVGPVLNRAGADLSLWWVLRRSLSAFFDDFGRFVAANVFWVTAGAVVAVAVSLHVAGYMLVVAMLPVTAGLFRMAGYAVREHPARVRQFGTGLAARRPYALLLGTAQVGVGLVSWVNFHIGLTAATLPLVVAAIASGWVLLIVAASAAVMWPLLLDPERDGVAFRRVVRLALQVALVRPGRVILVVAFEVLLVAVAVQALVATLLLPALGALFAAYAVLPVADRLEGREPAAADPGG